MSRSAPRILLGVTHAVSLKLMAGLPERLVSEGWDVHIVTSPGKQTALYYGSTITVHEIPMERRSAALRDLKALQAWVKLTRNLSPDVVFVGTPKAGLLGIMAAWVERVPKRIYHLRGLPLDSAKGMGSIFHWLVEKVVLTLSTQTVAVSHSLRRRVIGLRLVNPGKATVVGKGSSNGVDLTRFSSNKASILSFENLGLEDGIPVIGFVGRLTRDKGIFELVDASYILNKWGVPHQLLFVGPAEGGLHHECVTEKSGASVLVFTGAVEDTAPYYHFMDILCLPTHREGFPNVILEAGASGIATVTTDATGAVDSVVAGVTGERVPVGDSKALAQVLRSLLSDPYKRRRYAEAANKHIAKNFSRETVQTELVKYLQED